MTYKHLYGPVHSRRLGVSLGVDLVPFKTCSLDCIYCEVGGTTNLTLRRDEYVPYTELITELDFYLASNPNLDCITFSGAGEPTLYSRVGELVRYIKSSYPSYKLVMITNSTLLPIKEVREELLPIDIIMPSLDAVSEKVFQKINRPVSELTANAMVDGLVKLRQIYNGQMWLEIFFAPGINDRRNELSRFREAILRIQPDRVQLNTLDRPGTEAWIKPESLTNLLEIQKFLQLTPYELMLCSFPVQVEIIANSSAPLSINTLNAGSPELVLNTLSIRPCTAEDLSQMLNIHINEVYKILTWLVKTSKVEVSGQERGLFYRIAKQETE